MTVPRGWRAAVARFAVTFVAVVLLAAGVGIVAGPRASRLPSAEAQTVRADGALESRTREVAAQLRCPVCQGNSIQDSPSELAQEMKSLVRDQLASGKSPEEVKEYFVQKYGEWILLEPEPRGFNLLVYLLPVLAFAAGGFVIWRAVRKWTAAPG